MIQPNIALTRLFLGNGAELRYMEVVKRDMQHNGTEEAATQDRRLWAASVATATHLGGQAGR